MLIFKQKPYEDWNMLSILFKQHEKQHQSQVFPETPWDGEL